jgi:hypothetical protein
MDTLRELSFARGELQPTAALLSRDWERQKDVNAA